MYKRSASRFPESAPGASSGARRNVERTDTGTAGALEDSAPCRPALPRMKPKERQYLPGTQEVKWQKEGRSQVNQNFLEKTYMPQKILVPNHELHMLYDRLRKARHDEIMCHGRYRELMQELLNSRATLVELKKLADDTDPEISEFCKENSNDLAETMASIENNSRTVIRLLSNCIKEEKASRECQRDMKAEIEAFENKLREEEDQQKARALKASLLEVRLLRDQCEEYELEGREILAQHTDEELARIFNGIGPESFSEWSRSVLDRTHLTLRCCAFIHDVEFEHSDGTKEGFAAANRRFKRNGRKVANANFKWTDLRRYIVRFQASEYAWLCKNCGWKYWKAYAEKNGKGAK